MLIYEQTKNLNCTVRYLGIELYGALDLVEQAEV